MKGCVSFCFLSTDMMVFVTLHAKSTQVLTLPGRTSSSGVSEQVPTPTPAFWIALGQRGCPKSQAASPTGTLQLLPSPAACHISTTSLGTKRNASRLSDFRA